MIKCKINGKRNNLESKPVWQANGWYSYRTEDHFRVIDLPHSPEVMASMRAKIKISGLSLEIGN